MTTPNTTPLALPPNLSPDAIDTITELASILSRFRDAVVASSSSSSSNNNPPTTTNPTDSKTTPSQQATPGTSKDNQPPNPNTLIPSTDSLRHRFQRARAALLRDLPDMSRSIPEQEEEIRELERKLLEQRKELGRLRESQMAQTETQMQM